MLLAVQAETDNDKEIDLADEETAAVYKGGRISSARDKANVQCVCHCNRSRGRTSLAVPSARAQCRCCGWLI